MGAAAQRRNALDPVFRAVCLAPDRRNSGVTTKMPKKIVIWLFGLFATIILGGVFGVDQLSHPSLAPYADLTTESTASPRGLSATFLGTATLLFRDGNTQIMTDGFFSRPPPSKVLVQKLEPNLSEIQEVLAKLQLRSLDALFVAHSHYDHALDAARVASMTGADLIGSDSTANLARAEFFPDMRILTVRGGESMRYGHFEVTVYSTPHSPGGRYPGTIGSNIKPPLHVSDYREGGNFSFLLENRGHRILVVSSANFVPGLFAKVRADTVFLSIGTLGKQSEEFSENYWQNVVVQTQAKRVIPIHWDDFTVSLREPLKPLPPALDSFTEAMNRIRSYASRDGVQLQLPQAFAPIVFD